LQEVISHEDKRKPLTDDALVDVLKEKGYNIARRTIAKYREQLNIPVARLRKNYKTKPSELSEGFFIFIVLVLFFGLL
jgi:DNA-directed RNA polymerase specialized sigma54-like protein